MFKINVRTAALKKARHDLRAYEKAIERFLEGGRGANLEKLNDKVYSIRVNKKARIILTKIVQNGKSEWLWVDTLDDHDYESLLQKPKHWLTKASTKDNIENIDVEVTKEEVPLENAPNTQVELNEEANIELHDEHFICLDGIQKEATNACYEAYPHKWPLIISGAPGSGKSSTALSIMRQWIEQKDKGMPLRLLYITQSEKLAAAMQKEWEAMQELDPQLKNHKVSFKTPEQIHQDKPPAKEAFKTWLNAYVATQKRLHKKQCKWAKNIASVHQEFRVISGYSDLNSYNEGAGRVYSLYQDNAARTELFHAYQEYCKGDTDLCFRPIEDDPYDLIIADEAQDLSRIQLKSLYALAQNKQIVYCIGDHQQLHGSECMIPFLKTIDKEATHLRLRASYRCPVKVIDLANEILAYKRFAIGIRLPEYEITHVEPQDAMNQGSVTWINETDITFDLEKYGEEQKGNLNFAVITPPELIEEAQKYFAPWQIFTPAEIKGLQFNTVFVFCPFNDPRFTEVNRLFAHYGQPEDPNASAFSHIPEGNIAHSPIFNELFVALTRAQSNVCFYQPKELDKSLTRTCNTAVHHLLEPFQKFIAGLGSQPLLVEPQKERSPATPEELLQHAQKLREQGLTRQADAIEEALRAKTKETKGFDKHKEEEKEFKQRVAVKKVSLATPLPSRPPRPLPLPVTLTTEEIIERNELLTKTLRSSELPQLAKLLHHKHAITFLNTNLGEISKDWDEPINVIESLTFYQERTNLVKNLIQELNEIFLPNRKQEHNQASLQDKKKNVSIPHVLDVLLYPRPNPKAFKAKENPRIQCQTSSSLLAFLLPHLVTRPELVKAINQAIIANDRVPELNRCATTIQHHNVTLLPYLATNKRFDELKVLHALGVNLNQASESGYTIAHIRELRDDMDEIREFHKMGVDFVTPSPEGINLPTYLVVEGKLKMIKQVYNLLGAEKFNTPVPGGTPLMAAVTCGHANIVSFLGSKDKNAIHWQDNETLETFAHLAAKNNQLEVLKTIKELGGPLDKPDSDGRLPIIKALEANNMDCVHYLLSQKACPKVPSLYLKQEFLQIFCSVLQKNNPEEFLRFNNETTDKQIISLEPAHLLGMLGYEDEALELTESFSYVELPPAQLPPMLLRAAEIRKSQETMPSAVHQGFFKSSSNADGSKTSVCKRLGCAIL